MAGDLNDRPHRGTFDSKDCGSLPNVWAWRSRSFDAVLGPCNSLGRLRFFAPWSIGLTFTTVKRIELCSSWRRMFGLALASEPFLSCWMNPHPGMSMMLSSFKTAKYERNAFTLTHVALPNWVRLNFVSPTIHMACFVACARRKAEISFKRQLEHMFHIGAWILIDHEQAYILYGVRSSVLRLLSPSSWITSQHHTRSLKHWWVWKHIYICNEMLWYSVMPAFMTDNKASTSIV
jgi:hypothetical protein